MNIANQGIQSLARDSIVLAGSQLGSQTIAQDGLSGGLSENGDTQGHPGKLEAVSEHIEVSNREDEGDDGSISNT